MNYSALIQNRKSVRAFTDKQVPAASIQEIKNYHNSSVHRLIPELRTQLLVVGPEARDALEGAAGYHQFLVGAPQYLVLLSQRDPMAHLNGGFVMEDLILQLTDMGYDSCWVTFYDSKQIKEALGLASSMDVVAIAAFGYGQKTTKRLRLNIKSMSNVDVVAKHRYMEPKRSVRDLAFLETWGNSKGVEAHIGFFDDMLWEAFYAASLSPSYLNRQAYGFVIHSGGISLVSRPDEYNTDIDADLSLGIVLLHFTAVAENWAGKLHWFLGENAAPLQLPYGHRVAATCKL